MAGIPTSAKISIDGVNQNNELSDNLGEGDLNESRLVQPTLTSSLISTQNIFDKFDPKKDFEYYKDLVAFCKAKLKKLSNIWSSLCKQSGQVPQNIKAERK